LNEKQKEREREKEKGKAEKPTQRLRAPRLCWRCTAQGRVARQRRPCGSLGAYREAGNVAILRAKLKAEGYSSYTETVGDKVRVRAGPFPNKAAADKAAVRISKILGVQASVAAKP
jgi:DedD protein